MRKCIIRSEKLFTNFLILFSFFFASVTHLYIKKNILEIRIFLNIKICKKKKFENTFLIITEKKNLI